MYIRIATGLFHNELVLFKPPDIYKASLFTMKWCYLYPDIHIANSLFYREVVLFKSHDIHIATSLFNHKVVLFKPPDNHIATGLFLVYSVNIKINLD